MAFKIEKTESHFIFVLDSSQGQMGVSRNVDEGVNFNLFGHDAGLAAVVFDRRNLFPSEFLCQELGLLNVLISTFIIGFE